MKYALWGLVDPDTDDLLDVMLDMKEAKREAGAYRPKARVVLLKAKVKKIIRDDDAPAAAQ